MSSHPSRDPSPNGGNLSRRRTRALCVLHYFLSTSAHVAETYNKSSFTELKL